jgi:hypothetical protein
LILGPIREIWTVPRFGRVAPLLSEAAIRVVAMSVTARWVIRRVAVKTAPPTTIAMDLVALGILLPAEIMGALWLRGLSLREYLASVANVPGLISLVMFMLFAAMPTVVTLLTRGGGR